MDRLSLPRRALPLPLFLLTFALRLVTLVRLSDSPYGLPVTSDMKFYADWGRRIASGSLTDFHAFYGQPLYAYILGAIFALAGYQPFLVGLLQISLEAITAVLIFKIALEVFAETPRQGALIGGLAAVGWAFYTPAAAYSGLLIPSAFVTLSWWFPLWWILRRSRAAGWLEWLALAVFIGLAGLISAATLFLLPLAVIAAIVHRRGPALLALAAGLFLGTAPAWAHNVFIARDPVFISAHGGLNFWIGNNPTANGYPKIPAELPSDQAALLQESIKVAERQAGHFLPRSEVSKYWSRKGSDYIANRPLEWAALLGLKLKNFWSSFSYDDLSSITALSDADILLPGLHFGLVAVLGLPGAFFVFGRRRARWIIGTLALQMLALLPVFVNERYRMSAAPGLLILAAFFGLEMWRRVRERRWLPILTASGVLLVFFLFVSWPPTDRGLLSVDDFKTGRRQLIAGDFERAEKRLRLAAAAVVPAGEVTSTVTRLWAEFAREQTKRGETESAQATISAGLRIDPADATLRRLQVELAGSPAQ